MNNDNQTQQPLPVMEYRYRSNKTFAMFLDGVTIGVVVILVVVIGMLYMTQISVNANIDLLQLGLESGILYGATVSIYILLRSFARRKGVASDAWGKAFAAIERNNEWIVGQGLAARTAEYCRDWEETELTNSRKRILADVGISIEQFNELYLKYTVKEIKAKYPDLTAYEFATIKHAKKAKRLRYNEDYLSVYNRWGKRKSPSQRITVKTMERLTTVKTLITTGITSVFGVSMVLSLITDFSLATVVMCLVKIIIIIIFGTIGMVGGYNMSMKAVDEMNIKADEQNRFIKWCGAQLPPKPEKTTEE